MIGCHGPITIESIMKPWTHLISSQCVVTIGDRQMRALVFVYIIEEFAPAHVWVVLVNTWTRSRAEAVMGDLLVAYIWWLPLVSPYNTSMFVAGSVSGDQHYISLQCSFYMKGKLFYFSCGKSCVISYSPWRPPFRNQTSQQNMAASSQSANPGRRP